MIRIDFRKTYKPEKVAEDLSYMVFHSPGKSGNIVRIKVRIEPLDDPLLPGVCNLAFGIYMPEENESGKDIDDIVRVKHTDTDKVFSTILLFGLTFLRANPELMLGVDGSTEARAYLYHRMFRVNGTSLQEHFITLGVDWYVRLMRNNTLEAYEDGALFFKPRGESFDSLRPTKDLYRYYIFYLRR